MIKPSTMRLVASPHPHTLTYPPPQDYLTLRPISPPNAHPYFLLIPLPTLPLNMYFYFYFHFMVFSKHDEECSVSYNLCIKKIFSRMIINYIKVFLGYFHSSTNFFNII